MLVCPNNCTILFFLKKKFSIFLILNFCRLSYLNENLFPIPTKNLIFLHYRNIWNSNFLFVVLWYQNPCIVSSYNFYFLYHAQNFSIFFIYCIMYLHNFMKMKSKDQFCKIIKLRKWSKFISWKTEFCCNFMSKLCFRSRFQLTLECSCSKRKWSQMSPKF